jgi:hypothetical protein
MKAWRIPPAPYQQQLLDALDGKEPQLVGEIESGEVTGWRPEVIEGGRDDTEFYPFDNDDEDFETTTMMTDRPRA